jgi:hypothetical protein
MRQISEAASARDTSPMASSMGLGGYEGERTWTPSLGRLTDSCLEERRSDDPACACSARRQLDGTRIWVGQGSSRRESKWGIERRAQPWRS